MAYICTIYWCVWISGQVSHLSCPVSPSVQANLVRWPLVLAWDNWSLWNINVHKHGNGISGQVSQLSCPVIRQPKQTHVVLCTASLVPSGSTTSASFPVKATQPTQRNCFLPVPEMGVYRERNKQRRTRIRTAKLASYRGAAQGCVQTQTQTQTQTQNAALYEAALTERADGTRASSYFHTGRRVVVFRTDVKNCTIGLNVKF